MKHRWAYLIAFILLCELTGIGGSVFTSQSVQEWYPTLEKPAFTPPSWVFAPVWTTLYALMGISAYLVFISGRGGMMPALTGFFVQLFLNFLWSFAFFGMRSPVAGAVVIVALWIAIVWTIINFYRVSRNAAYLLVPYILWTSFAAILNFSIILLN
ncbi:tryptophan-rich sensory protein [Candidatus Micrarchaeota archaeon]|nr:tryptophan-rich sensory protein [Candidatus Micrarchaeota archaeon]